MSSTELIEELLESNKREVSHFREELSRDEINLVEATALNEEPGIDILPAAVASNATITSSASGEDATVEKVLTLDQPVDNSSTILSPDTLPQVDTPERPAVVGGSQKGWPVPDVHLAELDTLEKEIKGTTVSSPIDNKGVGITAEKVKVEASIAGKEANANELQSWPVPPEHLVELAALEALMEPKVVSEPVLSSETKQGVTTKEHSETVPVTATLDWPVPAEHLADLDALEALRKPQKAPEVDKSAVSDTAQHFSEETLASTYSGPVLFDGQAPWPVPSEHITELFMIESKMKIPVATPQVEASDTQVSTTNKVADELSSVTLPAAPGWPVPPEHLAELEAVEKQLFS